MTTDPDACDRCGAISGGTVRDPETGESVEIWWCVGCGHVKRTGTPERDRSCS